MRNIVLFLFLLVTFTVTSQAAPPRPPTMTGTAYGGNQPVVGSHVYLFSPGTTTGAASISLMNSSTGYSDSLGWYVLSNSSGDWSATGTYTCTNGQPVYAYAAGGNPGLSPGTNNTGLALMSYIGVCGSIPTSSFTNINEVSTIAMAYAIAGFATDPLHISYSGSTLGLAGIINAFSNQFNLESQPYGTAYSSIPSGYATVPQSTINTLANALASCVNTSSASSSPCTSLFDVTTSNGLSTGTVPVDTATSAVNIAHNPTANVYDIVINLPPPMPPFQPTLASAPNDLTIALTFTSTSMGDPAAIAIDKYGDAWVACQPPGSANGTPSGNGSIVEIANASSMGTYGTYLSPSGGWASAEFGPRTPYAIAIDASSSNVWVGTDATLDELSTSGTLATGSPFIYSYPYSGPYPNANFGSAFALNIDGSGDVWVAAYTTVYKFSSTGGLISSSSGYSLGNDAGGSPNLQPGAVAIDSSGNTWVVDEINNDLIKLSSSGTATTITGAARSMSYPDGVAIDSTGNVWIANYLDYAATVYSPSSSRFISDEPSGFSLGTASGGSGFFVSMDGSSNAWFAVTDTSCTGSSHTACIGTVGLSSAGSELTGSLGYEAGGYTSAGSTAYHYSAVVDGAGNEWIANTNADSVTELIGAATPVVTPLAAGVSPGTLASRP